MDINTTDSILYLAVAEKNSIFLINPFSGERLSTIEDIPEPRRILYIRKQNELFVTTRTTKCFFYSNKTLKKTKKIDLMSSSNAISYDSTNDRIYVGYEEGVRRVNAGKRNTISLPVSVNSMHIDNESQLLYLVCDNAIMVYYAGLSNLKPILSIKVEGRLVSSVLSPELGLLIVARKIPLRADSELLVYQIVRD